MKDRIIRYVAIVFLIVCFVLVGLPLLMVKLLMQPFYYIKFKRSPYQQDFPCKYQWPGELHVDHMPYAVIKENGLPVEYIKPAGEYARSGYFVYKDMILVFCEPFFFDEDKKAWLFWPGKGETESGEEPEETEDDTADCVTVEEGKNWILKQFHSEVPERTCSRVIVFYRRKKTEDIYGTHAVEQMRRMEDTVLYEKGKLAEAVKDLTERE